MLTTAGFIITAVVTLIGGAGGAALFQWLSKRRDQQLAERKDDREAGHDSVAIVNAWREQAKASAEDAAEARKEARAVRSEMVSMRADIEALLDRVGHLEDDQGVIVGYVTVVTAGVEAGTVPPLPPMPPKVQAILSHIQHKEQE